MINVALVEDNDDLRQALSKYIDSQEDMKCVAALGNLHNVISEFRNHRPDIVIMDIGLPNISGIDGVNIVKENFEHIEIIMFTVFDDNDNIFDAIKAGASGYLLKKSSPQEIIDAITELAKGGVPMTACIARKVIHFFQKAPVNQKKEYQLTARESEILHGLVEGMSYKKLAEKHFVSISTIRTHIQHIYEKLHVNSKAEAVSKVLRR